MEALSLPLVKRLLEYKFGCSADSLPVSDEPGCISLAKDGFFLSPETQNEETNDSAEQDTEKDEVDPSMSTSQTLGIGQYTPMIG